MGDRKKNVIMLIVALVGLKQIMMEREQKKSVVKRDGPCGDLLICSWGRNCSSSNLVSSPQMRTEEPELCGLRTCRFAHDPNFRRSKLTPNLQVPSCPLTTVNGTEKVDGV